MSVASDSYMGIFLPADIRRRMMEFMAGKVGFPFVNQDETLATFHLFGKVHGLNPREAEEASEIAKKTVAQVVSDIQHYRAMPSKLDASVTRQNYTKRSLQIVVESGGDLTDMNDRVAGDPAILADCFAQHIAYYTSDFFFELFGPLKLEQLPAEVAGKLVGRIVLLGFNAKNRKQIPFASPLEPYFDFIVSRRPPTFSRS